MNQARASSSSHFHSDGGIRYPCSRFPGSGLKAVVNLTPLEAFVTSRVLKNPCKTPET
jgi:hypothetical protein